MLITSSRTLPATNLPLYLALPTQKSSQRYIVQVDTESQLGGWSYTNTAETQLTVSRNGVQAGRYAVGIQATNFRQTNSEGLNRLGADMVRLKAQLALTLAPSGQVTAVDNRAALAANYAALRPKWLARYEGDEQITPQLIDDIGRVFDEGSNLVQVLAQSPELALLLPDFYDRTYSMGTNQTGRVVMPNVLITAPIPLITKLVRRLPQYPDVALDLQVTGELDRAAYAYDDIRTMLQEMTGEVTIDPTPDVQFVDTYEFNAGHELLYAARFFTCIFPGVFMTKIIVSLRPDLPDPTAR